MTEKDVFVMRPAPWMTDPSWFLVTGLPWPEDQAGAEIAEAAFAIAPAVTQAVRPVGPGGKPVPLGHDLARMLDAGSRCAAALGKRVVFLSDITRWVADNALDWERIGVDFAAAQNELEQQSPVRHGVIEGLHGPLLRRPRADDPLHRRRQGRDPA
jgi:hypothetical protein